ncbi:hypothetical protein [Ottowia sp. VDI28]|uniref:hypothetical protein n=1 Tax=Ottowia sp. VDI28 TaxID=3133968 RepID=UPI003C30BB2E
MIRDLKPGTVTTHIALWGIVIAFTLLLAVVGPAIDRGPTDSQADGAIALEKATAIKDAKASFDDARVEEWVRAAKEANPNLTEEQLSRVRAAAMYLEGTRR